MAEAVGDEIAEGLEEKAGQGLPVGLGHFENLLGGLEGFVALGIADFGEHGAGDVGGVETDFQGHGAHTLEGIGAWKPEIQKIVNWPREYPPNPFPWRTRPPGNRFPCHDFQATGRSFVPASLS